MNIRDIGLVTIVEPTEPLITLAEARQQCNVDAWGSPPAHQDDDILMRFADAAVTEIDAPHGWLGRALMQRVFRMTLPRFPARFTLPFTSATPPQGSPPASPVLALRYYDAAGQQVTMSPDDYRVAYAIEPVALVSKGGSWPSTARRPDAVTIDYLAGYPTREAVPGIIRQYVRERLGQMYANREMTVLAVNATPNPFSRDSLESVRLRDIWPR